MQIKSIFLNFLLGKEEKINNAEKRCCFFFKNKANFARIILHVLLACPIVIFAQGTPPLLHYTETKTEMRFFMAVLPAKTAFILPKNKPVLSIADATLSSAKQNLGSIRLRWKTTKMTDYFFEKYDQKNQTIFLKNTKAAEYLQIPIRIQHDSNQYVFSFDYKSFTSDSLCSKIVQNHYKRIIWHLVFAENEAVYGGGEQFSFVNVKGQKIPFLVEEQGIGRGDQPISFFTKMRHAAGNKTTTFLPIARFITSEKRSISCNDFNYKEFDFTEKNYLHWNDYTQFGRSSLQITLQKADKWCIVTHFDPQPAFMFKTILGLQGGTDTVLHKLKILADAGVAPSAIWIQDWCGRRVTPFGKQLLWNWQLDTARYPHFAAFRDSLKVKNIKLLGYINPFLAEGTALARLAAAKDSSIGAKPLILLKEERSKTPYLMEATGFNVHLLQFSPGSTWIGKVMEKEMVENGFSGWMADFGEWYPISLQGRLQRKTNLVAHNNYPNLWANEQRLIKSDNIAKHHDTLGIFMRSATQATGHIYWAGDQNTNWGKNDGFPSLVPALLSSGLSGVGINHGDIGGFTSFKKVGFKLLRDRELLYRWIELCAFTPIFRTHEGLAPDYNLQIYSDTASVRFFAKFSAIHNALFPYLMQTYHQIASEQLPMIRHLVLKYPTDLNVRDLDTEFMLGDKLLVIPVLKEGAKTVRGYLPKGKWRHFFTKETIETVGEWRIFDAPIGTPCVWQQFD